MIRVQTPSRLHFGLLSFPHVEPWFNVDGHEMLRDRDYGGVGLMVQSPGVRLSARPAADWSAEGPLAERALTYAQRFAQTLPLEIVRPQHIVIEHCAPEHAGLGTGTQLGLAVGRALAVAFGLSELSAVELAQQLGRGRRSALGIHGFAQGGFLVEAGKRSPERIAPLIARLAFPEAWRIVLIVPPWQKGLHDVEESQAFQRLRDSGFSLAQTDALCRLVLLGMLPALAEQDLEAFGDALDDFNRRVGEAFAPVQGGPYASPRGEELVAFIRGQGIRGVGQSSWGPTVFAVAEDEERAAGLARQIRGRFALGEAEVFTTPACNHGATLELMKSDT